MEKKQYLDNVELLKDFADALDTFGTEERRRCQYKLVYSKFTNAIDVRNFLDKILNNKNSDNLMKLSAVLQSSRDEWLDFIENANKKNTSNPLEDI
jgi:hypothetical protein